MENRTLNGEKASYSLVYRQFGSRQIRRFVAPFTLGVSYLQWTPALFCNLNVARRPYKVLYC